MPDIWGTRRYRVRPILVESLFANNCSFELRSRNVAIMPPTKLTQDESADAWDMVCALAELVMSLAGADARIQAIVKFWEVIGKVGVKSVAKDSVDETSLSSLQQQSVAPKDIQLKSRPVNIRAMLDALRIRAVEMDDVSLLALLEEREFRSENCGIALAKIGEGTRIREWFPDHWKSLAVLHEATIQLDRIDSEGFRLTLCFGDVVLTGQYAPNFCLSVSSSSSAAVPDHVTQLLSAKKVPVEAIEVSMEFSGNTDAALSECGVLLSLNSQKIPGFLVKIRRENAPETARMFVLLLEKFSC